MNFLNFKCLSSFKTLIIILVLHINFVNAKELVSAFVFPHGGILLDAETRDFSKEAGNIPEKSREESIKLEKAFKEAARKLMETEPELIILSTPHGHSLDENFVLYGNYKAAGKLVDEEMTYEAEIDVDAVRTGSLNLHLNRLGYKVEGLYVGWEYDPLTLRWAEVIPWTFIREAAIKSNKTIPKAIIIGHPARVFLKNKYKQSADELVRMGEDIANFIGNLSTPKRIAIVISCDLSHHHSNSTTSPYPYHPDSKPFDEICVDWAKLDRGFTLEKNSKESLKKIQQDALKFAGNAGSCGYTGLILLEGILKGYLNKKRKNLIFKSHFYYYSAPTYFGMMVSGWTPQPIK